MTMLAVQQFCRDDFTAVFLVCNPASVAESGMASEGDNDVFTAVWAGVHGKALGGIAAGDNLADFRKNSRTNSTGMFFAERIPMVFQYFADRKLRTHINILTEKSLVQRKSRSTNKD